MLDPSIIPCPVGHPRVTPRGLESHLVDYGSIPTTRVLSPGSKSNNEQRTSSIEQPDRCGIPTDKSVRQSSAGRLPHAGRVPHPWAFCYTLGFCCYTLGFFATPLGIPTTRVDEEAYSLCISIYPIFSSGHIVNQDLSPCSSCEVAYQRKPV